VRLALIAAAVLSAASARAADVRVRTTSGDLVGTATHAAHVFKGVPYAQPPLGPLRWAPPQPLSWTGERRADTFGSPCLQRTDPGGRPNGGGVSGPSSEDCLYLNVWAPAKARQAPVMVWLYGGGGTMGSGAVGSYHGDAFARDGVVLVTLNYRLGALGGFAHPALSAAAGPGEGLGNYHLLDAMAALRWVRDNAEAFGGDPGNVTVFGQSAGATMVANLLTSPMARGLFDKAIIQSTGSLPTPATPMGRAEARGAELATAVGLPGADASLEQLRSVPAADVVLRDRVLGAGLRTILDGRVKTQSIMDGFAEGVAIDVPLIIGTTSDEGRLSGSQRVATYAMPGAPVWQYFFDYVPDWRRPEQPNGVPHAGEIPYVFDTLAADRAGARMTPQDHAVAARVHSCWVAFAKAARAATALTCAEGFRWPARDETNGRAVAIFAERPRLGRAAELRSPPNGAPPGPTSRDED